MTKTITRDDVLRYIYNETSLEENLAVERQLILNAALMNFFKEAKETISKIDRFELKPSESVTNRILNYSGALKFESIS